jgi:hypothetical protein
VCILGSGGGSLSSRTTQATDATGQGSRGSWWKRGLSGGRDSLIESLTIAHIVVAGGGTNASVAVKRWVGLPRHYTRDDSYLLWYSNRTYNR